MGELGSIGRHLTPTCLGVILMICYAAPCIRNLSFNFCLPADQLLDVEQQISSALTPVEAHPSRAIICSDGAAQVAGI